MQLKTPGVYVRNITPPQGIVPVLDTALPVFIGYTERYVDAQGESWLLEPVRIKDLTEFEYHFGGRYNPETYTVYVSSSENADHVVKVHLDKQFYLYDSLLHFYENGGEECFILSIGTYEDAVVRDAFEKGLDVSARMPDPTIIVMPDAIRINNADDLAFIQQKALRQCRDQQNRVFIADLYNNETIAESVDPFRDRIGNETELLKYGAAYFPWLITSFDHVFRFRNLVFKDQDSGDILDPLSFSSTEENEIAKRHQELVNMASSYDYLLNFITSQLCLAYEEPPCPVDFNRVGIIYQELIKRLTVFRAERTAENLDALREVFLNAAICFPLLDSALQCADPASLADNALCNQPVAVFFAVQSLQNRLRSEFQLPQAIGRLIEIEKLPEVLDLYGGTRTNGEVDAEYEQFIDTRWEAEPVDYVELTDQNYVDELNQVSRLLVSTTVLFYNEVDQMGQAAEDELFSDHPFYSQAAVRIREQRRKLPPSGTMAGVYTATDRATGVWKAPANVALKALVGTTIEIDDQKQESLNIHFTGKSVNVIRAFRGLGIRVWGARTLAGNDVEWKYISVRRYFNFVEAFLKRAMAPFVFQPNDANTWTNVRNVITNFLLPQWRQGAMFGAIPSEAFFVEVGLGATMTAEDILEGRMIVEIGLAVSRPAEFVVIRYLCRMESL